MRAYILPVMGSVVCLASTGPALVEAVRSFAPATFSFHSSREWFAGPRDLLAQTDMVAVVRAGRSEGRLLRQPGDEYDGTHHEELSLPITITDLSVVDVLFVRNGFKPTAQVQLFQTGGTMRIATFPGGPRLERTLVDPNNAPLEAGSDYLLFLSQTEYEKTFRIVGSAQSRGTLSQETLVFESRTTLFEDFNGKTPLELAEALGRL